MNTIKAIAKDFDMEWKYNFPVVERRFVLVDTETGEIVDDAQGYGYTSAAGAHRAYGWKSKHRRRKE